MRISKSLFLSFAVALILASGVSAAQPCCAGAGVFTPGRLKLGEDVLAGLQLRAHTITGATGSDGVYVTPPYGTSEQAFTEDLFAIARPFEPLQVGVSIAFVQTRRAFPGASEFGGGLGDLSVSGRYELISPGTDPTWPGIAIVGAVLVPSGRPADSALLPLATDATGTGAFAATLGVDVEKSFGDWLFDVMLAGGHRFPRTVGGISTNQGLQASGTVAVGYTVWRSLALALDGSALYEQNVWVNGVEVPDSARVLTSVGLSAGIPIARHFRARLRAWEDLPFSRNQTAGPGIGGSVVATW